MFTLAILAAYLRKDARTAPGLLVAICWMFDLAFTFALVILFIEFIIPIVAWMSAHGMFDDFCGMYPDDASCDKYIR